MRDFTRLFAMFCDLSGIIRRIRFSLVCDVQSTGCFRFLYTARLLSRFQNDGVCNHNETVIQSSNGYVTRWNPTTEEVVYILQLASQWK